MSDAALDPELTREAALARATIPLVPYDTAAALDWATAFFGTHPGDVLRVWAGTAVPVAVLCHAVARDLDAGWAFAFPAVWLATATLGPRLATAAVRVAFTDTFRLSRARRTRGETVLAGLANAVLALTAAAWCAVLFRDALVPVVRLPDDPRASPGVSVLFAAAVAVRFHLYARVRTPLPPGGWRVVLTTAARRVLLAVPLGLFYFDSEAALGFGVLVATFWVPAVAWLEGRWAFAAEAAAVGALVPGGDGAGLHDAATTALLRRHTGGRAVLTAGILAVVLVAGLWAFDLACSALLGWSPVLTGGALEVGDPAAVATCAAGTLLVFAVGRLAWFATYVDVRVRRDCWDMERRFAAEIRALGGRDA